LSESVTVTGQYLSGCAAILSLLAYNSVTFTVFYGKLICKFVEALDETVTF
jgi:hypothetical protein